MSELHKEVGAGEPYVYEAQGESDHQIGVVPSKRQKTASEVSEDESGDKTRKRSYSFGSCGGRGDSAIMMEMRNLEERVQELHSQNSKLKSDLEASQDVCFNMLVEKDQLAEKNTQQLKILQAKISELEDNLEESQTACNASETRRKMVEERLLEVKRDNQQFCDEADDYVKEIGSLSGEVEKCRKQLAQKDEEVQVIRENSAGYIDAWIAKEKTELEKKIFELTGVIHELKGENKNLMEEMSSRNVDSYRQLLVSEEISSINLVSTPSQTEYSSTDNSQQTDSDSELEKLDSGNEPEMSGNDEEFEKSENSDDGPEIDEDTSSLSVSTSSTSIDAVCCTCRDLALPPSPSPDSVVKEKTNFKTVLKVVNRRLGGLKRVTSNFLIQLFVLFFVFSVLLRFFDPLQRTLEISTIACQYGRLEHPEPPLL